MQLTVLKRCFSMLLFGLYIGSGPATAQELSKAKMMELVAKKLPEALGNLQQFLRLPNDGNYPDQIALNKQWCDSVFTRLGFETTTLATNGAPLLFAQRTENKNAKDILFYLQIDGQPVDPNAWNQKDPFAPVLKSFENGRWKTIPFEGGRKDLNMDWRLFARSASDSKGPALSFISALQILDTLGISPNYNVKVIMDFQEELGSPHLPAAVKAHRKLLAADMVFIMDGTRHLSNLPTLTYGARGIATATITVFGAQKALHSGQYGNFAPNPVFKAARLISAMKDEKGRVLIPGFYDGVQLSIQDKARLASIPEEKTEILRSLGLAAADAVGNTYQEALQYPSLNVRGLKAAWVDKEVRTLIPEKVTIEIDMRLVPETPGERQVALLRQFIMDQGFHLTDSVPTAKERALHPNLATFTHRLGSSPFRTEMDSPIGTFLNAAMERVFGTETINMRTTGGSQPMAPFINTLGAPAVSIRIPNPDNNIHAPNENIRIGNFKEGILSCLAILTQPSP